MHHVEQLFTLQRIDASIAKIVKESSEAEVVKAVARYQSSVDACDKEQQSLIERLRKAQRALRAAEDDLARVESDLAAIEAKLYSGAVQNAKELASLNERLGDRKQRKSALEEEVLERIERVEALEAKLADANASRDALQKRLRQAQAELDAAREAWASEQLRLQGERTALRGGVDGRLLKEYDAMYERFGGRPVAKVENRVCTGCHVTLPTSAKSSQHAHCPHCGRLISWE